MKSNLFLCGAGNAEGIRLALRINEVEKKWDNIYILDDDPSKKGRKILGIEIIGPFNYLNKVNKESSEAVNLVARTTSKRKAAFEKISQLGLTCVSLIDPGVDLWGVKYIDDVIIYQNVTFSAGAVLDLGSVAFTGAVIGHGCKVGKYCIIAPGAVLNARIQMDEGVYIGTNASILPDLNIGAWSTIGLNSGVIHDIPAEVTVMGVPAEIVIQPEKKRKHEIQDSNFYSSQNLTTENIKPDIECYLFEIWGKLLNRPDIKSSDNFFDIGGNSLLALQLHQNLKKDIFQDITLIDLFKFPTIDSLSDFLTSISNKSEMLLNEKESKHIKLFRQRINRYKEKEK